MNPTVPVYMGPGVVFEHAIGVTPPCIAAGCRELLAIGYDPDRDEFVAQHGLNPEHQRRWGLDDLEGNTALGVHHVNDWILEIHKPRPAEAFIIDPETNLPVKLGDVTDWSIT